MSRSTVIRLRNRLVLRYWHIASIRAFCLWANAATCSTRGRGLSRGQSIAAKTLLRWW